MRTPKSNRPAPAPALSTSGGAAVLTAPSGLPAPGFEKPYASPLHWTFFAELLVIAYCVLGTALLVQHGEALWAVPMLFWAICLGLVAQLQMTPRLA